MHAWRTCERGKVHTTANKLSVGLSVFDRTCVWVEAQYCEAGEDKARVPDKFEGVVSVPPEVHCPAPLHQNSILPSLNRQSHLHALL